MKTLIASLAILVPVSVHAAPATTAKPMAVCVAQATGIVTARTKCKGGESPLSLSTVAANAVGPQGPKGDPGPVGQQGARGEKGDPGPASGVNFASCYKKQTVSPSTLNLALVRLECDDRAKDFLIADGIQANTARAFVNEKELLMDDSGNIPTGVRYWMSSTEYVTYAATGTIICCKR